MTPAERLKEIEKGLMAYSAAQHPAGYIKSDTAWLINRVKRLTEALLVAKPYVAISTHAVLYSEKKLAINQEIIRKALQEDES
jgi:hypothetical protein